MTIVVTRFLLRHQFPLRPALSVLPERPWRQDPPSSRLRNLPHRLFGMLLAVLCQGVFSVSSHRRLADEACGRQLGTDFIVLFFSSVIFSGFLAVTKVPRRLE